MAMLDLFRKHISHIPFVCATFNHGLRDEADDEVEGVRKYCFDFAIRFETAKENIADSLPQATSIEEHARNRRYAFLENIKLKYGYSHIVTAHNADDNAESFLMNLTRGCGIDGLCGIREIRNDNNTVRPLLRYTKQELLDYCKINSIPYWLDKSNNDTGFRRNHFRHNIIPLFKEINPIFVSAVFNTSAFIETDCDYLKEEAIKAFNNAYDNGDLSLNIIRDLHPSILSRVLRLYIKEKTQKNPNHVDTEVLLNLIKDGKTSDECELYEKKFRLTYTHLTDKPQLTCNGFDNIKLQPDKTILPYGYITITHKKGYNGEYNCVKPFNTDIAFVRSKKTGDYMHTPQGSGKSLKKLYTDKKIPAELRQTLPLITINDVIIWAYEIGTDRDFLPQSGEDYFQIEYTLLKETNQNAQLRQC